VTILELENWMKENCFNFENYSINGNAIFEGHGIDKIGGHFIWYYTERGEKRDVEYFQTEKEIVEFAFKAIQSDRWAKTHCIGFTTSKTEARELNDKLKELNIEFFQDEIPYYGLNRPVFRTLVLGCDINKVTHLKDKYYKEKE
jgi:hypothetical protein